MAPQAPPAAPDPPHGQQTYGAPYPPQGQAYGHQYNNWGNVRSLQARIDNVQRRIARNDNRDRITEREARHPGLALAGAAYRGSGIPAVLADGWRAATRLAAFASR